MYIETINRDLKLIRLTPENQAKILILTGGSVKGTKLPIDDQAIEFWNSDEEVRLENGDYLLMIGQFKTKLTRRQFEIITR